jgi:hypothetical protein
VKWRKVNDYYLQSDCGGYIVNRNFIAGVAVYEAVRLGKRWSGTDPNRGWDGSVPLLVAKTADECKAACEGGHA